METNKSHSRLTDDDDRKRIWLDLPYSSKPGKLGGREKLEKFLNKKIKRYFKEKVNIVVKYRHKQLSIFCPTNNGISWNQKENAKYIIQCPVCHNDYVGKTDKNIITRLSEHGKKEDQQKLNYKLNLYSVADIFTDTSTIDHIEHVYNSAINNCKILKSCSNWAIWQYLEAYHIKTKSSMINVDVKRT